jgi:hypothetical protein
MNPLSHINYISICYKQFEERGSQQAIHNSYCRTRLLIVRCLLLEYCLLQERLVAIRH